MKRFLVVGYGVDSEGYKAMGILDSSDSEIEAHRLMKDIRKRSGSQCQVKVIPNTPESLEQVHQFICERSP